MANIFVVDDNPDIVDILLSISKPLCSKVNFANNGMQLLEKIPSFNPDLILLDVMMPGMSFASILDNLKSDSPRSKIIIVSVVDYTKDEIIRLQKSHNIVDYVQKPFSPKNISMIIKKHIRKKE